MNTTWKALSNNNRRGKILLRLRKKDSMIPTEIAEHFKSTLPAVSIQLPILSEAELMTMRKLGKNRSYLSNRKKSLNQLNFLKMFISIV